MDAMAKCQRIGHHAGHKSKLATCSVGAWGAQLRACVKVRVAGKQRMQMKRGTIFVGVFDKGREYFRGQ